MQLKEENRLAMQRVYDNTQREIKRMEGIIEQQKRFNQERNYVTIASKQKSIDRLQATLEKPEEDPIPSNSSLRRASAAAMMFWKRKSCPLIRRPQAL